MEQAGQQIFEFLAHYGYWGMLPLMVLEGPVATIIAAILASLGAFNVYLVLFFSIAGDVIGDIVFYGLGYKYGMGFVHTVGKYMGVTERLVSKMQKYFKNHGGKTIFIVKSTTGLCWAAFTAAGMARMDFKKFVKYSIYGGIIWSSFLVAMGYFYGYLWRQAKQYIDQIGWIVSAVAIVSFAVITFYKKRQSRKMLSVNNSTRE